MPIEFSSDEDARLVRLRCLDPLTVDEVVAALERQIRDGRWRYATIVDARTGGLDGPQSVALFKRVNELVAQHGANGPVAFVTRTAEFVGGAELIAFRGLKLSMRFEVFWDMAEAERWLARSQDGLR